MKPPDHFSRREFCERLTAATSGLALLGAEKVFAQPGKTQRFTLAGFTKPFQDLSFEQTADVVARIGWDGIECPVRRGGQVLPERVGEDLPKLVQALKRRNLSIFSIATDIQNAADPLTGRVLRTAAKLGIKLYRLGFLHYDLKRPIPAQLESFRAGLRELLALNKELGLCAAIENHSGHDAVGAPVWDIYELIKDFDPRYFGVCFDIGHATIEGGLDWQIQFRLIESWLSAVYVKDFVWKKEGNRWKEEWLPLGQGMVDPSFVQLLARSSFAGPIVQHFEYPVGRGDEMVAAMKRGRETLQSWLTRANASPAPGNSR